MEFLASLFIKTNTVIVVLIAIIVFALYQYQKFSEKVNPIINEFIQINKILTKKSMNETATFIMNEMTNVAENASNKINDLTDELGNAVDTQKGLNESNSELYERVKSTVFTVGDILEKTIQNWTKQNSLRLYSDSHSPKIWRALI